VCKLKAKLTKPAKNGQDHEKSKNSNADYKGSKPTDERNGNLLS